MFKRLVIAVLMVMLVSGTAMAIDQSACDDQFVYHADWNVGCEGRLTLNDMGQHVNGVWEWDQTFLSEYNANNYTQRNGEEPLPVPVPINDNGVVLTEGRIDNRLWHTDAAPDGRLVFQGEFTVSSGYLIPSIWKFTVQPLGVTYDPVDCPEGPFAEPYTAYCTYEQPPFTWPGDTDPVGDGPCYDIRSSINCSPIYPDNGLITFNDSGIGYYMDRQDQDPNQAPIMIVEGTYQSTPITYEDIQDVVWVEGGQTRLPFYTENDTFYYMNYDMGSQKLKAQEGAPFDSYNNIYFMPFEGQIPVGDQTFTVNLKNGMSYTINTHIPSNTLMPVVQAKTYYTDIVTETAGKSGKLIKATEVQVEVANLKARTIINVDGDEALLIQFAEPDRAMELTNPNSKLRIWVAEPGFAGDWAVGENKHLDFLWLNCPLHTGSIVVPPEAWEWIKSRPDVQAGGHVVVGGMYREQYNQVAGSLNFGYHNRGFIESIQVPIN